MSKRTVWLLEAESGIYDDFSSWVDGIFSTPDRAMEAPYVGEVLDGWHYSEFFDKISANVCTNTRGHDPVQLCSPSYDHVELDLSEVEVK